MKDVVILYNDCCVYEIANTNYYLRYSGADVVFAGLEAGPVRSMEGYSLNTDVTLDTLDLSEVRSLILPGGSVQNIRTEALRQAVQRVYAEGKLVAAICAAVDIIDEAGILENVRSTHITDADYVRDKNVITARANAYVDFGIEIAKYLDLFSDEADLNETVAFWKYFKRLQ